MSLLVDVQMVPNKILELVKARILANRAKARNNQQVAQLKGPTRPRVQRAKFGADALTYRRPEPAAVSPNNGYKIFSFKVERNAEDQVTTIKTLNGAASVKVTEGVTRLRPTLTDKVETQSVVTTENTSVTKSRYTTKVGRDDSAGGYAILPVGPDSCIYCHLEYYSSATGELITEVEYTIESEATTTPLCGYTMTAVKSKNAVIVNGGTTSVQSSNLYVYKCFLVTRNTIHEISAPAQLEELLWTKLLGSTRPSGSVAIVDSGFRQFTYINQTFKYTALSAGRCDLFAKSGTFIIPLDETYPDYEELMGDSSSQGLFELTGVSPNISCGTTTETVATFTDGDGKLVTEILKICVIEETITYEPSEPVFLSIQKPAAVFSGVKWTPPPPIFQLRYLGNKGDNLVTPGIFAAIKHAGELIPENSDLSQVLKTYGLESDAPKVTLVAVDIPPSEEKPRQVRYDYHPRLLNPTVYYAPDDIKLRINRSQTATVPVASYVPGLLSQVVSTWDWGNPAYCRQQLLDLGFTPEDLTPTAPDPNAPE
jgi:hypothetical protein